MTCDLQVLRQPFPVKYRRHLSLLQPQVFDLSTLFVHLSRMMMLLVRQSECSVDLFTLIGRLFCF